MEFFLIQICPKYSTGLTYTKKLLIVDDHYTIIQEWQLPGTGVAQKRYPTYKVRRCGQEEIPHIQGQEQWL